MSRVFPLWAFLPHLISGNPAEKKTKKQKQQKKKAATIFCLSHKPLCQQYWCCRAALGKSPFPDESGGTWRKWLYLVVQWQVVRDRCSLSPLRWSHGLGSEGRKKFKICPEHKFILLSSWEVRSSWTVSNVNFFFPLCRIKQEAGYGAVGLSWKMNVAYWMPFIMVAVRNRACCQGTWMDYRDANLGQFSNQHLGVKAFLKEMK